MSALAQPSELVEINSIGAQTRETIVSHGDVALAQSGFHLAGLSDAARGYSFVRHRPEFAQILGCLEGEGEVLVDQEWVPCRAGQVYLTGIGMRHAYRTIARSRWQLAWLIYLPEDGAEGPPPRLIEADMHGMAAAIRELHRESVGLRSPILARLLVDLLLFYKHRLTEASRGDERLLRLWARVNASLQEEWTLDRLATSSHVSAEHLRRLCHLHHGTSPLALLRQMRLRRAASLLQRSRTSVEEVAAEVGYTDAFAFSKAFKRFFGINPSEQRRL